MILVIDNYDSFVFNLSRYMEELKLEVLVLRNDKINQKKIQQINPSHIVISPGPCTPKEAGSCIDIVTKFAGKIPILGVCLGHQVIGHVFGAEVVKAKKPMHGKASLIEHKGQGIFTDLPTPLKVGRYHSLIVNEIKLSKEMEITSRSEEGEVMSFSSKKLKIAGVQFHPESILTEKGHQLIHNFIMGNI